jgi:hypothetical protein
MVKFLAYSDVHTEFAPFTIPVQPDEANLGLVLAGDFAIPSKHSHHSIPLLQEYAKRFAWVIYVPGNHEYYRGAFPRTFEKIRDGVGIFPNFHPNVHVMNNQSIMKEDVLFICATLWTDFDGGNPLSMYHIEQGLNDYKLIRIGTIEDKFYRRIRGADTFKFHKESKEFIFNTIREAKASNNPPRKIVVVTHHAPSRQSIPAHLANDSLNGAYASELGYTIMETPPDIWIHGHIHDPVDYMIDQTRVVSNPRGYAEYGENPAFDPNFTITI